MSNQNGRKGTRKALNASPILKEMKNFDFECVPIECIHISTLNRTDEHGYYLPRCILPLN